MPEECEILRWLLQNGGTRGQALLSQIGAAHVISRCGCGCASIDMSIGGKIPAPGAGLEQVSPDYFWDAPGGGLCSLFAYAKGGQLAGIEVWSLDGEEVPTSLPLIEQLRTEASPPGRE